MRMGLLVATLLVMAIPVDAYSIEHIVYSPGPEGYIILEPDPLDPLPNCGLGAVSIIPPGYDINENCINAYLDELPLPDGEGNSTETPSETGGP